ncbi:excise [Gordonia phage DumpsterDude]|uniref:Excise n=1 Tax=Gordonia phage DumpsterDude TaxID=2713262 RepID=A0A6G8R0C6_9CAUD|nr:excise [Gordonia phage DumpsterDude]QIN93637.1 excise [Gordonia phage DumpsterDude]
MTFTRAQLDSLGVATDLRTAAEALGISKALAYKLAADDEFPVRVILIGGRYSVPTAGLREVLLGETPPPADAVLARLDRIADSNDEIVRILRVLALNTSGASA